MKTFANDNVQTGRRDFTAKQIRGENLMEI